MCSRESMIVAGTDGSPASVEALVHAFTLAQAIGGTVELVTAWEDTSELGREDETRHYRQGHRWAVGAQRAVMGTAARRTAAVPQVSGVVVEGDAAEVLAHAGQGAACIVMGRPPGDSSGDSYGDSPGETRTSTRGRCRALASCPVIVAPSEAAHDAGGCRAAARHRPFG